jgi:Uri superfamily endonuclease
MTHDDYVAENGDDVSVEVFRIIELDMSNRSDSTESCWLTWNQLEADQAWDYFPLCMSLVARVSSDVVDGTNEKWHHDHLHNLAQLGEFISAVYYRNHAFIDVDDYVMHAFRIPKPSKECDECGYVDDAVASHYEECSKLDPQTQKL